MDDRLFRWINRLADRTGWAHGFFTSYAKYGIVLFAVLLVVAYVDARQHDELHAVAGSVWAGGAALVALEIGQLIGGAIDRARPYETLTGVHLLVGKTTDFSFPSDHATVAGAVAVGLLSTNRRWGIVAGVLAVLMAFTRVYVGAHYPGDVLAGLALGGAVAAAGTVIVVPPLTRIAERLNRTRFRVLMSQTGQANEA
jgi:undecaprenyl-diphosphatase